MTKADNWARSVLSTAAFAQPAAHADSPAMPALFDTAGAEVFNLATATSYDCCSQTQTQGPGCCQVERGERMTSAARRTAEAQRLWPLAVA